MGAAASSARRAIRNWNATNRAIKYLDKTAKQREKSSKIRKTANVLSESEKILLDKNPPLEQRVLTFGIKDHSIKETILPEGVDYVPHSNRKLPQRFEVTSPIPPPNIEFGFAIPEVIPKGKIKMSQAISLIKAYQLKQKSAEQLAEEYELDTELTASICKYFSLFQRESDIVWVPPSDSKEKKILLDTPIVEMENQIQDHKIPLYVRMHELEPPTSS